MTIRPMLFRERTTSIFRPEHSDINVDITDGRYLVKLAERPLEIESALRLRHEVFNVELSGHANNDPSLLEFDDFDFKCRHLIVVDLSTGRTVGTYRLNAIESAGSVSGFYSFNEFSIEDLPPEILNEGVEIGRACIAPEHRNTKVLFLLWRGLASYLQAADKRFFFGCCSIFTRDAFVGERAYKQLTEGGHVHRSLRVEPRRNPVYFSETDRDTVDVELPSLFNMYLRIGARVCGPPMIDHEFGTIDFFVVCDTNQVPEKYRRMFFSGS